METKMRHIGRAGLALGTLALAFLFNNPSASADVHASATKTHGDDYAFASSYQVWVCDMERDGNGVYADVVLANGSHLSIWDDNGSQAGCSTAQFGSRIARFRVCEDHVGCSGWAYNP